MEEAHRHIVQLLNGREPLEYRNYLMAALAELWWRLGKRPTSGMGSKFGAFCEAAFEVRRRRGVYVAAVLTIIQAWRRADSHRAEVDSVVSYGGAWLDYCRYPLMWLRHSDPATALLEQVRRDPDGDALSGLMTEWRKVFGSTPTTVRKAVEAVTHNQPNLLDAMREFPVEERSEIGC